eukprot:UN17478
MFYCLVFISRVFHSTNLLY